MDLASWKVDIFPKYFFLSLAWVFINTMLCTCCILAPHFLKSFLFDNKAVNAQLKVLSDYHQWVILIVCSPPKLNKQRPTTITWGGRCIHQHAKSLYLCLLALKKPLQFNSSIHLDSLLHGCWIQIVQMPFCTHGHACNSSWCHCSSFIVCEMNGLGKDGVSSVQVVCAVHAQCIVGLCPEL